MKIITFTSNDLGISYGPSIHYLELWESMSAQFPDAQIIGYSPSWTNSLPVIPVRFRLVQRKVWLPFVRQLVWDFRVVGVMLAEGLLSRRTIFYIRLSSFHIFSALLLYCLSNKVAVEVNGSAIHDARSRKSSGLFQRIARLGEKLLVQRSDITFSVTPELRDLCRASKVSGRHVYVANGVSATKFIRRPVSAEREKARRLRGIYVGTFTAWDGACHIVTLANQFPDIEFLMVGDGGARIKVAAQAPSNVIFAGWIKYSDLPAVYASADFALVLYEQGRHKVIGQSSLKVREYMACELPIFTTKIAGNELVEIYDIGMLSDGRFVEDFSRFLQNLERYKAGYRHAADYIKREISWDRAALTTMNGLRLIYGNG